MKTIVLFVAVLVSLGLAQQTDYLFQQGVDAYQKGDYAAAIINFEAALQHGQESEALYYNLGNAFYKLGEIGKSILYYERAKKLAPRDLDIDFNLQIAQLHVVDKIPSPAEDFYFKVWQGVKNILSLEQFAVVTVSLYVLFILLIVTRLLVKKEAIRKTARYVSLPVLVLLVLVGFLFVVQVRQDIKIKHAIILADKVSVVSSPAADSTEMFALHEGVKVQVIARSGDFVRIRLTDGKDGWVPGRVLELI